MKTTFDTLQEAKESQLFKSGEFTRLIKNHSMNKFEIEIEDYGTPLSHQESIAFGKFMDMSPSIH